MNSTIEKLKEEILEKLTFSHCTMFNLDGTIIFWTAQRFLKICLNNSERSWDDEYNESMDYDAYRALDKYEMRFVFDRERILIRMYNDLVDFQKDCKEQNIDL